jgi:hypothetical protein
MLIFFFRSEYVWKKENILFGRCFANGPPVRTNPRNLVFASKHFLAVVSELMNRGILK